MSAMEVGLSKVEITPPLGTELCGFGPYLGRRAESVLHPLFARACLFRLGRTRLALVQLDLPGVTAGLTAEVRRHVTKATGIPGKNVMLCCTHTHSGPSTMGTIGWGEPNPAYLRTLPARIAAGVRRANRRFRPAELFYGEGRIEGVAVNRVGKPERIDRRLVVMRIESGGEVVAFLAHASVHPVVLGERNRVLSGDFVGVATELVAGDFPGSLGLFLQGACGDINATETNVRPPESLRAVVQLGERLAGSIRRALARARPLPVDRLGAVRRRITLPQMAMAPSEVLMMYNEAVRVAGCETCPERLRNQARFLRDGYLAIFEKMRRGRKPGRKTEVQGFALGDLLLLAHPAELFHGFYRRLRRQLRGRKLLLAGYSNDYVGYVPDRASFRVDRLPLPGYQYYAPYYVPIIKGEYRFREDVGEVLLGELLGLARGMEQRR